MNSPNRNSLFKKGDLVIFDFNNGRRNISCQGVVMGVDVFRTELGVSVIEYDIYGDDYTNHEEKCLYKHIDENCLKPASSDSEKVFEN